ncbi:MAG: hypothetical protein ABI358_13805 [Ginsengibacter sp.]
MKTKHLSALHNFYKEILELNTSYSDEKSIKVIAGESHLIFEETIYSEDPFYHFAFNIPNNKFEEAIEWATNKIDLLWLDDYKGYIADFVNWKAKSFYFQDPAGNILEMITRLELEDNADEPFSCRHIRNISEIGLVYEVDDFDGSVQQLLKTFPVHYFKKQPPLPHFRAIGDDEGLFIIVPNERVWFGTSSIKSKIFPMQIIFEVEKDSYSLKM